MSGVRIFTDGACSGHENPVGGWCALATIGSDEDIEELAQNLQTDGVIKSQRVAKEFERPDDGSFSVCAAILMTSGHAAETTNNRMELLACIEGIKSLRAGTEATVYSDSEYVVNAINKNWLAGWKKYGWTTAAGEPVANQDLWKDLMDAMSARRIMFRLVTKGDGTLIDRMNQLADAIAKANKKGVVIEQAHNH